MEKDTDKFMQEAQTTNEEFSYDVISYPSFIIPQTHPEFFAAIAKLYGMNPAPAEKCRVLELGCADGTNSNWLAYNFPESEFVGVDLAKNHIVDAEKNKADLDLQNVSFFQQDVLDITEKTFGKFDYIIAHGLYSWVPDFVREKILGLYGELLNPNGVGFISYNVYPGCYRRQIVGDMMRFYTEKFENPVEKVEQGVGFIDFLTKNSSNSPVYQGLLEYELEGLSNRTLENIYHDDLSENNQAFYFSEFISEAEKYDLKFLSECDYLPSQRNSIPGDVAEIFRNISRNTVEFEQYSDFLECRRFRQTLLCKKDVALETEINPLKIKEFYISSLLKPTSPTIDLNPTSPKEFISIKKGDTVNIKHVLTKVVLSILVNVGSRPIKFADLLEKATEILQAQGIILEEMEKEIEILATILLQLYSPNAVRFHISETNIVDYVSEKPVASKFARWQSTRSYLVNNYYGEPLNVQDYFIGTLLNLLDGSKTREDLINEFTELINANEEIEDKETVLAEIPERVNQNLFILAKMGFLVG